MLRLYQSVTRLFKNVPTSVYGTLFFLTANPLRDFLIKNVPIETPLEAPSEAHSHLSLMKYPDQKPGLSRGRVICGD